MAIDNCIGRTSYLIASAPSAWPGLAGLRARLQGCRHPPGYLKRLTDAGDLWQHPERIGYDIAHDLAEARVWPPYSLVSLISALHRHELTAQLSHAVWMNSRGVFLRREPPVPPVRSQPDCRLRRWVETSQDQSDENQTVSRGQPPPASRSPSHPIQAISEPHARRCQTPPSRPPHPRVKPRRVLEAATGGSLMSSFDAGLPSKSIWASASQSGNFMLPKLGSLWHKAACRSWRGGR